MKNSILLALLLLQIFYSCGQTTVDIQKATEFYNAISAQIKSNTPVQQNFIDKVTDAIKAVKENKNVSIDTKELQIVLENAKTKNIEMEKNIQKLVEVDNGIHLKQKTLDYVISFNDVYLKWFPEIIEILAEKKEDRFERTRDLL